MTDVAAPLKNVSLASGFKLQFDTGSSSLRQFGPAKNSRTGENTLADVIGLIFHFAIKRHGVEEFKVFVANHINNQDELTPAAKNATIKLNGKCTLIAKIDGERMDYSINKLDENGNNNADAFIRSAIDLAGMFHGQAGFNAWFEAKLTDYD